MQNIDWHVKIQMLQNIKYLPMKDKQQQQQQTTTNNLRPYISPVNSKQTLIIHTV